MKIIVTETEGEERTVSIERGYSDGETWMEIMKGFIYILRGLGYTIDNTGNGYTLEEILGD